MIFYYYDLDGSANSKELLEKYVNTLVSAGFRSVENEFYNPGRHVNLYHPDSTENNEILIRIYHNFNAAGSSSGLQIQFYNGFSATADTAGQSAVSGSSASKSVLREKLLYMMDRAQVGITFNIYAAGSLRAAGLAFNGGDADLERKSLATMKESIQGAQKDLQLIIDTCNGYSEFAELKSVCQGIFADYDSILASPTGSRSDYDSILDKLSAVTDKWTEDVVNILTGLTNDLKQ
jgi:hypothetical protein